MKVLLIVSAIIIFSVSSKVSQAQAIFVESFGYPEGTNLIDNVGSGWDGGSSQDNITIASTGLTFSSYVQTSTDDKAATIGRGDQILHNTFSAVSSGSVFVSFCFFHG